MNVVLTIYTITAIFLFFFLVLEKDYEFEVAIVVAVFYPLIITLYSFLFMVALLWTFIWGTVEVTKRIKGAFANDNKS